MIKRWLIVLGVLFALSLALAFAGYQWLERQGLSRLQLPEEGTSFELRRGQSVQGLSRELAERGWIESPELFRLWMRVFGPKQPIQAGFYHLPGELSQAQLIEQLVSGQVQSFELRWVEGSTVKQFLQQLSEAPHITKTLALDDVTAVAKALEIEQSHLEGLIFPATYRYHKGMTDLELLQRARRKLDQVLDQEWAGRAENLPYKTPYEALIMASIIEKETGVAHERAEIAGVFVRRLHKGMRLQTDPTVIYGMGDRYQGKIRYRHLREATPYNTYVIPALPPTPIAAAGREAIHAALHPAPGKSLYFVAKGDGSHQFSNTLSEHNKAVRTYQLQRRSDYRSSPGEPK